MDGSLLSKIQRTHLLCLMKVLIELLASGRIMQKLLAMKINGCGIPRVKYFDHCIKKSLVKSHRLIVFCA